VLSPWLLPLLPPLLLPGLSPALETGRVTDKPAGQGRREWRLWTVVVPCALAMVWSVLLALGSAALGILASWGNPAARPGWLGAGAGGQAVLFAAALAVLVVGMTRPRWRQAAVITAWAIIPVAFGWFVLTGRLASGSW
jgi:hypothetical protein